MAFWGMGRVVRQDAAGRMATLARQRLPALLAGVLLALDTEVIEFNQQAFFARRALGASGPR